MLDIYKHNLSMYCFRSEDNCRAHEFNPKLEGSNKEGKELTREADFQSGLVLTRPKAARLPLPPHACS